METRGVRRQWTLCLFLCMLALSLCASAANHPRIITFDAPGAGTGAGFGTTPLQINPEGTIVGVYNDSSDVYHGFLRAPDGTITTVDIPGVTTGPGQGPALYSINPAGVSTGWYNADTSNVVHGFLRARDGTAQGPRKRKGEMD
jgi:hypothetical protein